MTVSLSHILQEAKAFKAGRNPPASQDHFPAFLLAKGYRLDELSEPEWRRVSAEIVGDDRLEQEVWLEDLAGWIGQPYYGD